jgi:hypothetical protein
LLKQWWAVLIGFLGFGSPVSAPPVAVAPAPSAIIAPPVHRPRTARLAPAVQDAEKPLADSMVLAKEPLRRRYTYVFEGQASNQQQPCPNASVLVRVTTSAGTRTQGTVTNADGTYMIEMVVEARDDEPVDWAMEAFTPEFKKVEMVGRRIVTKEETTVTVEKPVHFQTTLLQRL